MCVAVELEEKTSRKRHKFLALLTASRGHRGRPTVHSKFILCVCVSVISRATDGTARVCVSEERETGSVLAPPHSSRQSVHLLSLSLSVLLLFFFFFFFYSSVASISEAAGAAQKEQVAAFKVVKTTQSREKRTGEECVCVCVCEGDNGGEGKG